MYIIKWRTRRGPHSLYNFNVITGISRYPSPEAATNQVNLWANFFPNNDYYIELSR